MGFLFTLAALLMTGFGLVRWWLTPPELPTIPWRKEGPLIGSTDLAVTLSLLRRNRRLSLRERMALDLLEPVRRW